MKKFFVLLLSLLLCGLVLLACSNKGETPEATVPEPTYNISDYKSTGNYPKLQGQLTWEGINSFPIKSSTMTTDEARSLCVDFFRYSKTALWIADNNFQIYNSKGEPARTVEKGKVYGGLPYVGVASGNVYRTMDYMDPATGVVNVQAYGENPEMFGNQCSVAAWWGWARVINSAKYEWTYHAVKTRGFEPLGPHYYDPELKSFSTNYGTDECCQENGMNVMMESYAELKKGDGIMYMTTAGHIVMISSDDVVVRRADGTIDPTNSYVTVLDQTGEWVDDVNEFGEPYRYEANVDARWSFMTLFNGAYLPYTYKEFLGTDPIEDTVITYSHKGDTITQKELRDSYVECNYGLVDVYASVYDSRGNEVYKIASRAEKASRFKIPFESLKSEKSLFEWGSWDDLDKTQEYTIKVYAQVGTGERPTLWEGKVAF